MKGLLILVLPFFLIANICLAQRKIAGSYNAKDHTYSPDDANILTKVFSHGAIAPYMIKGKNPFVTDSNSVGFMDTTGKVIIKPKYNNCSYFQGDRATVLIFDKDRSAKAGLINRKGKIIIPPIYNRLLKCVNGLYMIARNGELGFVDKNNKIIVPLGKYEAYANAPRFVRHFEGSFSEEFYWYELPLDAEVLFKGYIGVKFGKKWAVIDSLGKEIIPPIFDGVDIFSGNHAVVKIGHQFGVTNISGKLIIPAPYDRIEIKANGFFYVFKGQQAGILNNKNETIIPVVYNNIEPFGTGFTAAQTDGSAVLFDINGNQIARAKYPVIHFPTWGNEESAFSVYNSNDKKYYRYDNIRNFPGRGVEHVDITFYMRNKLWGIIDLSGRELTPPSFDGFDLKKLLYIGKDHQYLAIVRKNKWGVVNSINGKSLLLPAFDQIYVEEGRIIVQKSTKFGIINADFKQITDVKYDSLVIAYSIKSRFNINEAFIRARIKDKWGLINSEGKEVVPFNYDDVQPFSQKLAMVKLNGKFGLVSPDKKGIPEITYDQIQYANFFDGRNSPANIFTKKDGKFGLLDSLGLLIAPPIYQEIVPVYSSNFIVKLNGKLGILNGANSKVMIPCEYESFNVYGSYFDVFGKKINQNAYLGQNTSSYVIAGKNGYFGLIDSTGKVCFPFVNSNINYLDYGRYYIERYEKHGIIDSTLSWIIPPKYHDIRPLEKGIYIVRYFNNYGIIDESGKLISEPIYSFYRFCEKNIILKKDAKFGAIDRDGNVVEPFIYKDLQCDGNKLSKSL